MTNAVQRIDLPFQVADPMVSMIERVVLDPNASIEKLQKMLEMRERIEDRAREEADRQKRTAYFRAMAECQKDLPVVVRNRKNDHTRSSYADLAAIETQAMPVIHDHGFTVSFQPAGMAQGCLRIKWTVAHNDGHWETDVAEVPIDAAGAKGGVNKTDTQAFGSTATYARRYLLCMLFNISTGDDNDGNARKQPEGTISADQFRELRDLIDKAGANEGQFLGVYGVTEAYDLPAKMFDPAKTILQQRIAKKAAEAKPDA